MAISQRGGFMKKFSSVTAASANLSNCTYTGTITPAIKRYSSVTQASASLSNCTYSGTITPAIR